VSRPAGILRGVRDAVVLRALRGDPAARAAPDPSLIAAARAHLEAAAAGWVEALPEGVIVRVTKDAVAGVRRCELRHVAELAARDVPHDRPLPPALVRGRLLDALFRQVATSGSVGDDPVADAVAACAIEDDDVGSALLALDEDDRALVRDEVVAAARRLASDWPVMPAGSGLRTQERILVELAGGRVVLSGRPDLTVGRPTRLRAGVLVVEAKSGGFRAAHLDELRFYVLLEALRWQVAPFRAVVWSLGEGRIEVLDVDADLVWSETLRVADAVARLARLAAGEVPRASGNPLCPSCPLVGSCPDGLRQVALAGGALPDDVDDEDEDEDDVDDGIDG
jgi:hypothetical protein